MDQASPSAAPGSRMTGEEEACLRAELRRAREREERLTAELQRRVTNLLAVIRSIFSRTLAASDSFEEVAHHFRGRLDSYARTQAALVRSSRGAVELEDLVRDELMEFHLSDGPRLRIDGPQVRLKGQSAELMGVALHELATNAAKFGMLLKDAGRLECCWAIEGEADAPRLAFWWQEHNVAVLAPAPLPFGFGRDFIETGMPYQIGAVTRFELRPGGVRCEIELALPADVPTDDDAPLGSPSHGMASPPEQTAFLHDYAEYSS